jgi:hypothetical protein
MGQNNTDLVVDPVERARQAADRTFQARIDQVMAAREYLMLCCAAAAGVESPELDRAVVRAEDLLTELRQDMQAITNTLGHDYDLGGFTALIHMIEPILFEIGQFGLMTGYVKFLRHLPQDWHPVGGQGGHTWYRGAKTDKALLVLDAGHYDATTFNHGDDFGVGTYFSSSFAGALGYGSCTFGHNLPGLRILRAKWIPVDERPDRNPFDSDDDLSPDPDGFDCRTSIGPLMIERKLTQAEIQRLHRASSLRHGLAVLAKDLGYDAVEYLQSYEGHILLAVVNLPVTGDDVVLVRYG